MKRRSFFALLLAAAGVPVLAKKTTTLPIKAYAATPIRTYTAVRCSTGSLMDGPIGNVGPQGPAGCPIGPPGHAVFGPIESKSPETDSVSYWTSCTPYKAGDVVRYNDGSESTVAQINS